MQSTKYYVVIYGRNHAIYTSEDAAKAQTDNYPDGCYETYQDYNIAVAAFEKLFPSEPDMEIQPEYNTEIPDGHSKTEQP